MPLLDAPGAPTAPGEEPPSAPGQPTFPITWSSDPHQIYGPTTAPNTLGQPTNYGNIPRMLQNLGTNVTDTIKDFVGGINIPSVSGTDPFGGLPPGFTEDPNTRFDMGAPTFTGPDYQGPVFEGGTIFGPMNLPVGAAGGAPSAGAIALGLGPLPGATVGGGGPANLGSSAFQSALFHGIWGGKAPLDYNTWNAGAGTPQGWSSRVGGNYQNYLNIWNRLRSQPQQPPTKLAPGTGSGGGPTGAGRPAASST